MDTIIYTCIINDYDELLPIETKHRAICFTDLQMSSDSWEVVKITPTQKIQKKIKICPQLFLPPHARNVWIDGNLFPFDIDELIKDKNGFWLMSHPNRNCIYQEAVRCLEVKKDTPQNILPQIDKYRHENYPANNGMVTASVLIRDHSDPNIAFSNLWWDEVRQHSSRDQLSFNYAAWKLDLQYNTFPYLDGFVKLRHKQDYI